MSQASDFGFAVQSLMKSEFFKDLLDELGESRSHEVIPMIIKEELQNYPEAVVASRIEFPDGSKLGLSLREGELFFELTEN